MLDLLSPVSLLKNVVNLTSYPPPPYVAYHIPMNDTDLRYYVRPIGSRFVQALVYGLLAAIPILTDFVGVWLYLGIFYDVKFNKVGRRAQHGILPVVVKEKLHLDAMKEKLHLERWLPNKSSALLKKMERNQSNVLVNANRKTILIATMEYDIADWEIKIKIGGLGVMAQTMGRHLEHQDLIWIVPCVSGIHYPTDQRARLIIIKILDTEYTIQVQYHHFRNITYVLLDASVFSSANQEGPLPRTNG